MILFKKKTFQLFYFLSWFSLCFRGYFFQKIIGLSTSSSQMFFLKLLTTPTVPLFQIFNTRKPPFLHTPGISEIPQAWTEVLSYTLQQSWKKRWKIHTHVWKGQMCPFNSKHEKPKQTKRCTEHNGHWKNKIFLGPAKTGYKQQMTAVKLDCDPSWKRGISDQRRQIERIESQKQKLKIKKVPPKRGDQLWMKCVATVTEGKTPDVGTKTES